MKKGKNLLIVFIVILLSSCTCKDEEYDYGVECRLFYVSDSYPRNTNKANIDDFRMICINYMLIYNTSKEYFLPIRNRGLTLDSLYCSGIIAFINKKPIETWFSTNIDWEGVVLKPHDSIDARLYIPERLLDSVNVNKGVSLTQFMDMLEVEYKKCLSDTVYSALEIPHIQFTKNDSIAYSSQDETVIYKYSKSNELISTKVFSTASRRRR